MTRPKEPRDLIGKISHWGRVNQRSHILTAKVPDDFELGDTFLVRVLTVPNCDDCQKKKKESK